MTSTTLTTAVKAIRVALDSEAALITAQRGMRSARADAYVAVRSAQESGQTQATIGKAAKVSPATVGDMLTAAGLHPSAWDVLDILPARQGVRFTTLHSLVAGARKGAGTPAVREIIATAAKKAAGVPREDGAEPDPAQVAKVWAAAIRKLWDASAAKPKGKQTGQEGQEGQTGQTGQEGSQEGQTGQEDGQEDAPPSLDGRLSAFAREAFALREAIAHGGACSREHMAAAMQEARDLARDLAEALSNTARATA